MRLEMQDMTELTPEQVGDLMAAIVAHLTRESLRVGVTLLILDGKGVKTLGNMPPEAQKEAMRLVVDRMETIGADEETDFGIDPTTLPIPRH
jgi:hypothetical protein